MLILKMLTSGERRFTLSKPKRLQIKEFPGGDYSNDEGGAGLCPGCSAAAVMISIRAMSIFIMGMVLQVRVSIAFS